MPELPEVEAVRRIAERALRGRRIIRAHLSRRRLCAPQTPEEFTRAVAGRRFTSSERRGKNILLHFDEVTLWIHLRMTGRLYPVAGPQLRPASTSAYFLLDDGRTLVFEDPRGLGVMRAAKRDEIEDRLSGLGIDPLSKTFTADAFASLARASRGAVKPFLMDQKRIAGLGNIYAAEALFRAGIDPRRKAASLSPARIGRLREAIAQVLVEAVGSAERAYQKPGAFAEGESFHPAVYGREGESCRRCGCTVRRIRQGGRSTYFCPGCQR